MTEGEWPAEIDSFVLECLFESASENGQEGNCRAVNEFYSFYVH